LQNSIQVSTVNEKLRKGMGHDLRVEGRWKIIALFSFCSPRPRPMYVEIYATGNDPLEVNEEEFIS
jgi:hypothetical protein